MDNDRDKDNGQEGGTEEDEAEVHMQRMLRMLENQRRYMEVADRSAHLLQMLSRVIPGVPEVDMESVSEESSSEESTNSEASTPTPDNGEDQTRGMSIDEAMSLWAEPIMACQLIQTSSPYLPDARRYSGGNSRTSAIQGNPRTSGLSGAGRNSLLSGHPRAPARGGGGRWRGVPLHIAMGLGLTSPSITESPAQEQNREDTLLIDENEVYDFSSGDSSGQSRGSTAPRSTTARLSIQALNSHQDNDRDKEEEDRESNKKPDADSETAKNSPLPKTRDKETTSCQTDTPPTTVTVLSTSASASTQTQTLASSCSQTSNDDNHGCILTQVSKSTSVTRVKSNCSKIDIESTPVMKIDLNSATKITTGIGGTCHDTRPKDRAGGRGGADCMNDGSDVTPSDGDRGGAGDAGHVITLDNVTSFDHVTPLDHHVTGACKEPTKGMSMCMATRTGLNTALSDLNAAAETIRLAREMLSSFNLGVQSNNNNRDSCQPDAEEPAGDVSEKTKDESSNTKTGQRTDNDTGGAAFPQPLLVRSATPTQVAEDSAPKEATPTLVKVMEGSIGTATTSAQSTLCNVIASTFSTTTKASTSTVKPKNLSAKPPLPRKASKSSLGFRALQGFRSVSRLSRNSSRMNNDIKDKDKKPGTNKSEHDKGNHGSKHATDVAALPSLAGGQTTVNVTHQIIQEMILKCEETGDHADEQTFKEIEAVHTTTTDKAKPETPTTTTTNMTPVTHITPVTPITQATQITPVTSITPPVLVAAYGANFVAVKRQKQLITLPELRVALNTAIEKLRLAGVWEHIGQRNYGAITMTPQDIQQGPVHQINPQPTRRRHPSTSCSMQVQGGLGLDFSNIPVNVTNNKYDVTLVDLQNVSGGNNLHDGVISTGGNAPKSSPSDTCKTSEETKVVVPEKVFGTVDNCCTASGAEVHFSPNPSKAKSISSMSTSSDSSHKKANDKKSNKQYHLEMNKEEEPKAIDSFSDTSHKSIKSKIIEVQPCKDSQLDETKDEHPGTPKQPFNTPQKDENDDDNDVCLSPFHVIPNSENMFLEAIKRCEQEQETETEKGTRGRDEPWPCGAMPYVRRCSDQPVTSNQIDDARCRSLASLHPRDETLQPKGSPLNDRVASRELVQKLAMLQKTVVPLPTFCMSTRRSSSRGDTDSSDPPPPTPEQCEQVLKHYLSMQGNPVLERDSVDKNTGEGLVTCIEGMSVVEAERRRAVTGALGEAEAEWARLTSQVEKNAGDQDSPDKDTPREEAGFGWRLRKVLRRLLPNRRKTK